MTSEEIRSLSQSTPFHISQVEDLHEALPEHLRYKDYIEGVLKYCMSRGMSVYPIIVVFNHGTIEFTGFK